MEVAVAGSAGQLVEIAFKVSNAREEHRARVVKVFDTARPTTPRDGRDRKGGPRPRKKGRQKLEEKQVCLLQRRGALEKPVP